MENIFKTIKLFIFIGVIIYLSLFTLSIYFTNSKYIDFSSLILIAISVIISLILLKISHLNNVAESKISLVPKILFSHLSIIVFTGIPLIWNDLNSSAWFSGVGSIIFGIISAICLVIFSTCSYFAITKFPNSKYYKMPIIILCFIMLVILLLGTYEYFDLQYLISNHNTYQQPIKIQFEPK